jgi:hypothetical protein
MALLDYLLGGAAGGFQGYEAKKASDLRAKQDEEERQMRLASLFSQGFEPVADVQRKKQDATDAARSLAVAAMNSTRGAGMSLPSAASQQSLMQGYAEAKPERTISYGGQQLAMRETPTERQDRLARGEEMRKRQSAEETARVAARAKTAEQERLTELAAGALRGGPKSPEAVRLALENPSAYKAIYDNAGQMTEYQRAMLGLSRDRLAFDRDRAAQERATAAAKKGDTGAQGTVIQEELDRLTAMMPVPKYGTGKDANKIVGFNKPTTDLSPKGVSFAQSDWTNWLAGDEAQFYYSMAGSIADAKARRSETGVLSNQDIDRYRRQIVIRVGDSDQTKYDKFQRLLRWAKEGGSRTMREPSGSALDELENEGF